MKKDKQRISSRSCLSEIVNVNMLVVDFSF